MKKHILLLGGWKTPIEAILNNAHDISYFGTFNSGTLFDISMLKKAIFKQEINLENSALCLYYAKKLHDIKAFDAVVTFNENALNSAIIIKDALKLNKGLDLYPSIVTKNKHLTRNILNSSKLLKLPFITSKNYHDIVDFLKKHKKIVVKPKSGSASQNVVFIDNKRKLKSLMNNINIDNYIVEKYIGTSLLYSVEPFYRRQTFHFFHYRICFS